MEGIARGTLRDWKLSHTNTFALAEVQMDGEKGTTCFHILNQQSSHTLADTLDYFARQRASERNWRVFLIKGEWDTLIYPEDWEDDIIIAGWEGHENSNR